MFSDILLAVPYSLQLTHHGRKFYGLTEGNFTLPHAAPCTKLEVFVYNSLP